MEVEAKQNRCASGLGSRLAPGFVELDDDRAAQLTAVVQRTAGAPAVEEGDVACPTGAIWIIRAGATG